MIEVKLEDFEKYRKSLTTYAVSLLRSSNFNNKKDEIGDIANDIVQETYLVFHKHVNDAFVSDFHLSNFLKVVVYNKYRYQFNSNSKVCKYNYSKSDISVVKEIKKMESPYYVVEGFDYMDKFKSLLTDKQRDVLDLALEGYGPTEIGDRLQLLPCTVCKRITAIKKIYEENKKI